jgi:predicted enzyme related to lactoylglutathione lyase
MTVAGTTRFFGPLACVEQIEEHLRFLGTALALEVRAVQRFDRADVAALWGVERRSGGLVWLELGSTGRGLAMLQFTPSADDIIFGDPTAAKSDLVRAVEVEVGDVRAACRSARSMGLGVRPANEQDPAAEVTMADGIRVRLRRSQKPSSSRSLPTRTAEEIGGVEIPVADLAEAAAFYELLEIRYRTRQDDSASDAETAGGPILTAAAEGAVSLRGRCLPPRRGLVGLLFDTDAVSDVRRRVESAEGRGLGCRVVASARGLIHPRGVVESLLVQAPNGILHQFLSRR